MQIYLSNFCHSYCRIACSECSKTRGINGPGIAELSTDNRGVAVVPVSVAYRAPGAVVEDLHTSLVGGVAVDDADEIGLF